MNQLALPTEVTPQEVARERSLGDAMALCVRAAGFEPKEVMHELKMDKAQWSRWESGAEGIVWPKFTAVMDKCGNDAPLMWMNHARGWDLHSMRRRENEMERQIRLLREENTALKRVLLGSSAA